MSFTLSSIKKIYSSTPLNNVNIIKIHNEIMNSYSKDTFNSIIKYINLNKLNNKINIIENYTNISKVELSIIYGTQTKISQFPGYVTLLEGNIGINYNNSNHIIRNGSYFVNSNHIIRNNYTDCSVILCHYDKIIYPKYMPLI